MEYAIFVLNTLREDFEMLRTGQWDGSEKGCLASIALIDDALSRLNESLTR